MRGLTVCLPSQFRCNGLFSAHKRESKQTGPCFSAIPRALFTYRAAYTRAFHSAMDLPAPALWQPYLGRGKLVLIVDLQRSV